MLLHDPGVLHRHEPPAKLHHPGSTGNVSGFERRMFKFGELTHDTKDGEGAGVFLGAAMAGLLTTLAPFGRRAVKSR